MDQVSIATLDGDQRPWPKAGDLADRIHAIRASCWPWLLRLGAARDEQGQDGVVGPERFEIS